MTFYEKMRIVCLSIPTGRVATYGQIAMLCGKPKNARQNTAQALGQPTYMAALPS